MIVVHHLNNSRSQRVLWLLEELDLPYEVRNYERDRVSMLAPPELLQVHPLGKSPVISDGALTLAESGAILEYLADKYGGGRLSPAHGTDAVGCRVVQQRTRGVYDVVHLGAQHLANGFIQ